jgi:hypothetical protein
MRGERRIKNKIQQECSGFLTIYRPHARRHDPDAKKYLLCKKWIRLLSFPTILNISIGNYGNNTQRDLNILKVQSLLKKKKKKKERKQIIIRKRV